MDEYVKNYPFRRFGHVPECDDPNCDGDLCYKHDDISSWPGRFCSACRMPDYYHGNMVLDLWPCEDGIWIAQEEWEPLY